jgi:ring-1,2-phenylacetyl-CoA epoxidase subunit PaaD
MVERRSNTGGRNILAEAYRVASSVCDPELPVLTIEDLGVLRGVSLNDGVIEVSITPTYSGCPAMDVIALEIELALAKADIAPARIKRVLAPAWTSDNLSAAAHDKLKQFGIAPPGNGRVAALRGGEEDVACPLCGSGETEKLSQFGSTACKSLWRCLACREPFEHFKCH